MTAENPLFSCFKAYDMRGTMDVLSPEVYYWLGRGFVQKILEPEHIDPIVIIARDGRYNGTEYYQHLAAGIRSGGGAVVSLGLATTDMVYAAALLKDAPAIMITASHNPAEYNGCKIVKKAPQMLGLDSGLALLRDYIIQNMGTDEYKVDDIEQSNEFKEQTNEFLLSKIEQISGLGTITTPLKIVVDTANGAAGVIMEKMRDWYPNIEWVPLFWDVDPRFPNHPSDPMPAKNREQLAHKVLATHADFGAFLDGDGDRCVFVDEKGELISGDFVVALFARHFLKKSTKLEKNIVYIEPNSRVISRTIIACGGIAINSKQGHTFVKTQMQTHDALYGGEGSAHHYFSEFGYMDSGCISLALFCSIFAKSDRSASTLCADIATGYFLSGEHNYRLDVNQTIPQIIDLLKNKFSDAKFCELDGITIAYPDWRCNIRGSNTEPLLRFNVETNSNTLLSNPFTKLSQVLACASINSQNQV